MLKRLLTAVAVAVPLALAVPAAGAQAVQAGQPWCTTNSNQSQVYPASSSSGRPVGGSGNEYNSDAAYTVCGDGGPDLTVTRSALDTPLGSAPAAYASFYAGDQWRGDPVTPRSGLPVPVSALTAGGTCPVHLSLTFTPPRGGIWDSDFDTFVMPPGQERGQPGGWSQTEIMVFTGEHGQIHPGGTEFARNVAIGGRTYDAWGEYTQQNPPTALVIFVMTRHDDSVNGLSYCPFVAAAQQAGYVPATWTVPVLEAGLEIWKGGLGAKIDSVRFATPGRSTS